MATRSSVALHPGVQRTLSMRAAPSVGGEHNTLRAAIMPFACWRVDDVRFDFDSSFVLPDIADELAALAQVIDEHTKDGVRPPASVFGHADPTGDEAYNKTLSGRRGRAIYGLLARDVALWESLFTRPHGGDDWQARGAVRTMLTHLGYGPGDAEVRRFQGDHGCAVDGAVGPQTRRALYRAYMDALCPIALERRDFLGEGADPGGKGDVQGCGEFNPALVFSRDEAAALEQPANHGERDAENAANRRVLVFLFRPGTRIDLSRWPCPRVDEDGEGCRARFWSDGQVRRAPGDVRRSFQDTQDTFACRFYHRLSDRSPCEGVLQKVAFEYGLPLGEDSPWSESAAFCLVREQGGDEAVYPFAGGRPVGAFRFFVFRGAQPGVRYRGEVRDGEHVDEVFGPVELYRLQDPGDEAGQLPPAPPSDEAPDDAGAGDLAPGPEDAAVADAAEPHDLSALA